MRLAAMSMVAERRSTGVAGMSMDPHAHACGYDPGACQGGQSTACSRPRLPPQKPNHETLTRSATTTPPLSYGGEVFRGAGQLGRGGTETPPFFERQIAEADE